MSPKPENRQNKVTEHANLLEHNLGKVKSFFTELRGLRPQQLQEDENIIKPWEPNALDKFQARHGRKIQEVGCGSLIAGAALVALIAGFTEAARVKTEETETNSTTEVIESQVEQVDPNTRKAIPKDPSNR